MHFHWEPVRQETPTNLEDINTGGNAGCSPTRSSQRRRRSVTYVFFNFFSNLLLMFGKLWGARSRLYRRHFLQANTRLKALDEIYKIYTLLHRSEFENSAKCDNVVKHYRMFAVIFSKCRWCFAIVVQSASILMKRGIFAWTNFRNYFSKFYRKD